MELRAAIRRRRMTRAFASRPVDGGLLEELLDLARRAPSAGNTQATGFVLLDRPGLVERYWDVTLPGPPSAKRERFRWQRLLDAPVLVLVTTEPGRYLSRYAEPDKAATGRGQSEQSWPVPYWWVDAGAVIQNLLLLATEAGLGACLFGPFENEPALRAEFELAPDLRLAATIALGHPLADEPGRSAGRARAPLADVVHRPGIDSA